MGYPYTHHQLDAVLAAETSVGLTLTALVWARPIRPKIASFVLLAAVWLAVVCPYQKDFLEGLGGTMPPDGMKHAIRLCSVLVGLGALLSGRLPIALVGVAGSALLFWARGYILESDYDMAAAHTVLVGMLIGISYAGLRPDRPRGTPEASPRGFLRDDLAIFVGATALAAFLAVYVMHLQTSSGDEWADTFQAAVFWKGKAYAGIPECGEAFRTYWVYPYKGRSFAQYTPGWPLFMAPFLGLGAVWMAGPAALGLMAVGVAQVARRAASGLAPGMLHPLGEEVRAAGIFGGLLVALGGTIVLNAGSRYPHVFVGALFVWSVELLLRICDPKLPYRMQWILGVLLGSAAALLVSTRPADGVTLHLGLVVFAVYGLVRRLIGVRAFVAALVSWLLWSALTLVILRLQLGVWFKTGYSITLLYHGWNKLGYSVPKPDELRASMPLGVGSYCWWPISAAVGAAGLLSLRGRARRITFIFTLSCLALVAFFTAFEMGRHGDSGIGPRYEFPCVVPMAVGTAVMLAKLWARARSRVVSGSALAVGGPMAVALASLAVGTVRLIPLVYPEVYGAVHSHNRLQYALEKHPEIHHAVVIGHDGVSSVDSLDLTENLPLDLYPKQDVLLARSNGDENEKCIREHYGDRAIYHVRMKDGEARVEPDKP